MNETQVTCRWCVGSGRLGPRSDEYVCPPCNGTGRVDSGTTFDPAVVQQIEANRLQWLAER